MTTGVLARRPVRGATALRAGRVRRPSPYQLFGLLFWLVMTLAYWRVPPCCDAGQHAAAVARLRAGLPDPDLVSPYVLAQGALARLTGLSGWAVLRICGPLNLLVLLTGVARFVRVLTPRVWAPVLALALMSVLWGTTRVWGGGYLALMPMTGNLGFPSSCAIGLAFWAWALTGARARDTRPVRFVGPSGLRGPSGYAVLGALYGLVALVDPVIGVGAAVGGVAFVAGWQRGPRAAVALRWVVTAGAAALVAGGGAAAAGARASAVLDAVAAAARSQPPPAGLAGSCWLALLLGLPALWLRARRGSWRDPLVLLAALVWPAMVCGRLGGLLGLALVAPQCALAVELAAARPWPVWRRVLGWTAAGGVCLGLLTVQAGAVVPRALDPVGFAQPPRWPSYDWAARYLGPGDVVLADDPRAVRSLPGYGAALADAHGYLSPVATRAERAAIVRRHRVRWLLLTPRHRVPAEAVVVAWSRRTGEVLARVGQGEAARPVVAEVGGPVRHGQEADADRQRGGPVPADHSMTSSTGTLPRVALE
ncbi:hypothetical protein [Streptomyces shenzhenensis]|uniref:hypothetical protein n=1 Tax=Streptomyces shenzhenensis TaxID=943815 RepID=UPI00217D2BAF|nr:hypothetical protein [Streptomyces shenzhenensis]